jgi:hypothetical protein
MGVYETGIIDAFGLIYICTGDFFEEWNGITPQTHIRKFEELTA